MAESLIPGMGRSQNLSTLAESQRQSLSTLDKIGNIPPLGHRIGSDASRDRCTILPRDSPYLHRTPPRLNYPSVRSRNSQVKRNMSILSQDYERHRLESLEKAKDILPHLEALKFKLKGELDFLEELEKLSHRSVTIDTEIPSFEASITVNSPKLAHSGPPKTPHTRRNYPEFGDFTQQTPKMATAAAGNFSKPSHSKHSFIACNNSQPSKHYKRISSFTQRSTRDQLIGGSYLTGDNLTSFMSNSTLDTCGQSQFYYPFHTLLVGSFEKIFRMLDILTPLCFETLEVL